MRAHYLQHVPFEGLGSIAPWSSTARCAVTSTRFFEPADFPAPEEIDLLIVLGGPMSVNDEAEHPWLVPEKHFIRRCIQADKPLWGICLGAQLIASAMGARVYRHHTREIGWFPIEAAPSGRGSTFGFPPSVDVFHWHGETFELPKGATLLARSDACENQAFQLGRSVIGLQFHLETTPEAARKIVDQCREEIRPSEYVQSEAAILAAPPEKYQRANGLLAKVLSYLLRTDG